MKLKVWNNSNDVYAMLAYLTTEKHFLSFMIGDRARVVPLISDYRLRLFAHVLWEAYHIRGGTSLFGESTFRQMSDISSQWIEGTREKPANDNWNLYNMKPLEFAQKNVDGFTGYGRKPVRFMVPSAMKAGRRLVHRDHVAGILRDIVGNPQKPHLPLWQKRDDDGWSKPLWLTSQVISMAESLYAERFLEHRAAYGGVLDPVTLGALADAVEEAPGATGDPDRLPFMEHLRSPGLHFRGMWSVELILGKERFCKNHE